MGYMGAELQESMWRGRRAKCEGVTQLNVFHTCMPWEVGSRACGIWD